MDTPVGQTYLTWTNVAIGSTFIVADSILSLILGLGVGQSLITAAVRCILQLSLMAMVLQKVFEAKSFWAVAGITILLNLLGTFEVVANKSKMRFAHMFPFVLFAMAISTIPVSIIGSRLAMSHDPFWTPEQYIPIVGMLCGSTISGIVIGLGSALREIHDNRDKVEMYLAFGASRSEACKPIVVEALRLALTPAVNQMSVIGLISIPGMMTGAILGGSSVEQAARLQMIIVFMITASTGLASMVSVVLAMSTVVDSEHRIRVDRVYSEKHAIWRARDAAFEAVVGAIKDVFLRLRTRHSSQGERQPLLGTP